MDERLLTGGSARAEPESDVIARSLSSRPRSRHNWIGRVFAGGLAAAVAGACVGTYLSFGAGERIQARAPHLEFNGMTYLSPALRRLVQPAPLV